MTCRHKHTAYQPSDIEWRCPVCGSGIKMFFISESMNEDCVELHTGDHVICNCCTSSFDGDELAEFWEKKARTTDCPHCKGTGKVEK